MCVCVMNVCLSLSSLIKMVYSIAAEQKREPRWRELEHAIRRNFGGLDLDPDKDPVRIFQQNFARVCHHTWPTQLR